MENGFNDTEREKGYVRLKESPRNESFADGSVGARVRLMVREGRLPVRESETMTWRYDDCRCGCGLVETEMQVLFECTLYDVWVHAVNGRVFVGSNKYAFFLMNP